MLNLITDRTIADVERWQTLDSKGWAAMSAEEQTEWMGEMKGRYGYTDMNRVEAAVETIATILMEYGYIKSLPTIKTTWNLWSVPTVSDMERYLCNISLLRSLVPGYPTTPSVPDATQPLDYNTANDIEKILEDLYDIATKIPNSWYHTGEIYAGEV